MYQPADQHIQLRGQPYILRLTLGTLAEISQSLNADGPKALSLQMKTLTPKAAQSMLTALLRPCHSGDMPELSGGDLTADVLRAMAVIFEQSFQVLTDDTRHE